MPITFVKLVDLYVGTLVFLLLNVAAVVRRPFVREGQAPSPRRILLVKFWGIGSILLLQPVMRALKRAHPGAELTLLTLSRNQGLFPLLDSVDRFETLDLERTSRVPIRLIALSIRVRRGGYDWVVDCEFFAKLAAILTFFSGAPVRVGFHRREPLRRRLYTAGVAFQGDRHVTEAFAALLEPLGVAAASDDYLLPPPGADAVEEADGLLRETLGDEPPPFVAMNVNASELAFERRWGPEKFAELARKLGAELDVPVLLVGAPGERAYVETVRRQAGEPPSIHNLAGRTTVVGLHALLRRALLFVSNDSGPLHLAATSGVSCVALFGPETPALYGPVGEGHLVFYRNLPCSPCMSVHDMKQVVCHGQIDCLRDISVEEVFVAICRKLGRTAKPSAQLVS